MMLPFHHVSLCSSLARVEAAVCISLNNNQQLLIIRGSDSVVFLMKYQITVPFPSSHRIVSSVPHVLLLLLRIYVINILMYCTDV